MSLALTAFLGLFALSFLLRIPIAFGMLISSIAYFVLEGMDLGVVAEQMVFGLEDKFILLAVPLFIFTARIMNSGGITDLVFRFAGSMVGHMRGGLANVCVAASVIFSGMTGSAIAEAAGLGVMELKAMDTAGYKRPFSAALIAASATIGPIIPPSIPMVIYAMLSGASVGALFLGGVVPGLLMAAGLMAVVHYQAPRKGYPRGPRPTVAYFLDSLKAAALPLLTPVILLGGIYTGVFTPTEAAAVAALYALVLMGLYYRKLGARETFEAIKDVVENTGFLGLIIAGAMLFSYVVAREQIPAYITELMLGITTNKWALLFMMNVLFLALGCVVDTMVLLLVVIPIVIPVVEQAGINMVHFGVVIILNMMIGLVTPPFGMLIFIMAGLSKEPMGEIIRELVPFIAILVAVLLICTYVPDTVLALPRLFGAFEAVGGGG